MLALKIVDLGAPLQAVELPDPEPGHGEVVVGVRAAGICRSDVHYRSGHRPVPSLPLVPGHEVAGVVERVGPGVAAPAVGDRVAIHYLTSCGACEPCHRGREQFCVRGEMIGLDRAGGYAEQILVPAANALPIPDEVSWEAAAVMMCSTSTSFHALRRARLAVGESVAVFGAGGLGMSAVQLAFTLGAFDVYAVDINPAKLEAATRFGAIPVDATTVDPAEALLRMSGGGVDVALELVGSPEVMGQAVRSVGVGGRAIAVGITDGTFGLDPFRELVAREAEILGAADHTAEELRLLLEMARRGDLDLDAVVTRTVGLDVTEVEGALQELEGFGDEIRTVIRP
ncbi:MAG: zinc-binding dehydrogenase [Acidimicrobiia bacterium]|nr:zinc-binding dehydrogenase [Acidimicrobiia bacterium]